MPRRPGIFFVGWLLAVAGLVLGVANVANAMNTGTRFALTTVLIIIGILVILAGVQARSLVPTEQDGRRTAVDWPPGRTAPTISSGVGEHP